MIGANNNLSPTLTFCISNLYVFYLSSAVGIASLQSTYIDNYSHSGGGANDHQRLHSHPVQPGNGDNAEAKHDEDK